MLDFTRIGAQLSEFADYQSKKEKAYRKSLARALEILREADMEEVHRRLKEAPSSPLLALPVEPIQHTVAPPPRPTRITLMATDGSQVFPGREVEPPFYLINIGRVVFYLGTERKPLLESVPELHYREDLLEEAFSGLTPQVFTALRDEKELSYLLEVVQEHADAEEPRVALLDGTLIRWSLQGIKQAVLEQELIGRYVRLLGDFQKEAIPLAGYISRPASREVINVLHLFDEEQVGIAELRDHLVFFHLLQPGERSALFRSSSHIQQQYGEHAIHFFYLHMGAEVGRVEVPEWVAASEEMVNLVHAAVWDQGQKGGGYPVILAEAHERAVIRAEEQEALMRLLRKRIVQRGGGHLSPTRKQWSKRIPRI